jgi:hypothetical protein
MKRVLAILITIAIVFISPIVLVVIAALIPLLVLYLIYTLVLCVFDSPEQKLEAQKEAWKQNL